MALLLGLSLNFGKQVYHLTQLQMQKRRPETLVRTSELTQAASLNLDFILG